MFAVKYAPDVAIYVNITEGQIRGVDAQGFFFGKSGRQSVTTFRTQDEAKAIADQCINWPDAVIVPWEGR